MGFPLSTRPLTRGVTQTKLVSNPCRVIEHAFYSKDMNLKAITNWQWWGCPRLVKLLSTDLINRCGISLSTRSLTCYRIRRLGLTRKYTTSYTTDNVSIQPNISEQWTQRFPTNYAIIYFPNVKFTLPIPQTQHS